MQSTCNAIDPTLHHQRMLYPSSVIVYQVERDGSLFVLKIAESSWDRRHLRNEERVLTLCPDVEGITHLIQAYHSTPKKYPHALLKEYQEGKSLRPQQRIPNPSLQRTLERTVEELHDRRIAGLDLDCRNVVVSPDNSRLKIVDLGTGLVYPKTEENAFRRDKDIDFRNIERISY